MVRLDERWPKDWPEVVSRLNEQADLGQPSDPEPPQNTVAYVVRSYRQSDRFRSRALATQKIYERWLRDIERLWGLRTPADITRRVAVSFVERVPTKAQRVVAGAVLYNVLDRARYLGLVKVNEAAALGLSRPKPRDARWSEEDIKAFLGACEGRQHASGLRLGLLMLLYTGQRPVDVMKMSRADYDGDVIRVVQQKTRKKLEVPVHRDLKVEIDAHLRGSNSLFLISRDNGLPFSRRHFGECAGIIKEAAGLAKLQLRDLRRTAVVKLAEAGAEIYQIAAVTGHSTNSVKVLVETYLVRTTPMARAAIKLWENEGGARESNAVEKRKGQAIDK
jgi:integrase